MSQERVTGVAEAPALELKNGDAQRKRSSQGFGVFLILVATASLATEAIAAKMAYRYGATVEEEIVPGTGL